MAILFYAAMGAVGGLVRLIVTGKGIIPLPRVVQAEGGSRHLNLGFLAPCIIGALAGYLVSNSLGVDGVVAAISGYTGSDAIENIFERGLRKRNG